MSEVRNTYLVSGIIVADSLEAARVQAAKAFDPYPERNGDGPEDFVNTLLSVIANDPESEEGGLWLVEDETADGPDFLGLVHVVATDEESAVLEIVRMMGNSTAFRGLLGTTGFDPDDLEVSIAEALPKLEDYVLSDLEDDAVADEERNPDA